MELDLPSHRREVMLFREIKVGFQDERGKKEFPAKQKQPNTTNKGWEGRIVPCYLK